MLGAITGDIVGSIYEFDNILTKDFPFFKDGCFFTDDTVMTIATADAIARGRPYGEAYMDWGNRYPGRGYGNRFLEWLCGEIPGPYNSLGNGSAMRVSPIGWRFDTLEETLGEAKKSAECTHNHPEGIKGAQAVAAAIFLARNGKTKQEIRKYIEEGFQYDLSKSIDDIIGYFDFDETCPGTVPESFACFYEADSFEDTIRSAILLGGDCDTTAAIAGSIAEAYYGIPEDIKQKALGHLTDEMRTVIADFSAGTASRKDAVIVLGGGISEEDDLPGKESRASE